MRVAVGLLIFEAQTTLVAETETAPVLYQTTNKCLRSGRLAVLWVPGLACNFTRWRGCHSCKIVIRVFDNTGEDLSPTASKSMATTRVVQTHGRTKVSRSISSSEVSQGGS